MNLIESGEVCFEHVVAFYRDCAGIVRVSSVGVERQHIWFKEGGQFRLPTTIQKDTYATSVRIAHASAKAFVEESLLSKSGAKKYQRLLRGRIVRQSTPVSLARLDALNAEAARFHRPGPSSGFVAGSNKKPRKAAATPEEKIAQVIMRRTRSNSGWNAFVQEQGKCTFRIGSPEYSEHAKAYSKKWQQLPPAEKAGYHVQADAHFEKRKEFKETVIGSAEDKSGDGLSKESRRILEGLRFRGSGSLNRGPGLTAFGEGSGQWGMGE